jgi:hypothetical protein
MQYRILAARRSHKKRQVSLQVIRFIANNKVRFHEDLHSDGASIPESSSGGLSNFG